MNAGKIFLLPILAAVLAAGPAARADDSVCAICNKPITDKFYRAIDRLTEEKVAVCVDCEKLDARCFACGLPVLESAKELKDGRRLCARDEKAALLSDEDAKKVAEDMKDDMDRHFSRFMTFPAGNITISVVDQFSLQNLFKTPGYEQACSSVFGATSTHRLPNDRFAHSVNLLSALCRSRLRAVCAHEFTHAWMGENVSLARRQALTPETIEGFCELVAYRMMEADNEAVEQRVIKANNYTRGQFTVLLEAEDRFGFNALVDWIKSGEDEKLTLSTLDRVRAVKSATPKVAAPRAANYTYQPATAPDRLILKSVSGPANRRFALINDKTLAPLESARIRLGPTNVLVRCLEIRSNSALLQVGDAGEKLELKLETK